MPTRALLLSAYIKFINLFPETKATIQEVLRCDSQIRNSDVELQQRAVEYLKLSSIASTDVLVSFDDLRSVPSHLRSSNETMKTFARSSGLHMIYLRYTLFKYGHSSRPCSLVLLSILTINCDVCIVLSFMLVLSFPSGHCPGGDASLSREGVVNPG